MLGFCHFCHKVLIYHSVEVQRNSSKIARRFDCLVAKIWNVSLHMNKHPHGGPQYYYSNKRNDLC